MALLAEERSAARHSGCRLAGTSGVPPLDVLEVARRVVDEMAVRWWVLKVWAGRSAVHNSNRGPLKILAAVAASMERLPTRSLCDRNSYR